MSALTEWQQTVLGLIEKANGKAQWHSLETTLSRMIVTRDTTLIQCLKLLEESGFIVGHFSPGGKYTHWQITEAGVQALTNSNDG